MVEGLGCKDVIRLRGFCDSWVFDGSTMALFRRGRYHQSFASWEILRRGLQCGSDFEEHLFVTQERAEFESRVTRIRRSPVYSSTARFTFLTELRRPH